MKSVVRKPCARIVRSRGAKFRHHRAGGWTNDPARLPSCGKNASCDSCGSGSSSFTSETVRGYGHPEGLDRLASYEVNVGAADAEVIQFTVAQAAQFGNGFPVTAPVAVIADQVHGLARLIVLAVSVVFVRSLDRRTWPALEELNSHGSNAFCAMQYLTSFTPLT